MRAEFVWLAAGLAGLVLEVLAPGVFLMWLGLAALGTGAAAFALGLGFAAQSVLFALLAAALCVAVWRVTNARRRTSVNTARSGLVGRTAVVLAPHDGQGRVRLGDSDWPARPEAPGPMPPEGTAVQVTAVAGTSLLVRPANV